MAHKFQTILICLLIPILSYGQLNFFRTHSTTSSNLADIVTTEITEVNETTATGGGNVLLDGGSSVTDRGCCWGTSENPTTADSHTHDGTGTGSFVSSLTSLSAGTLYYVRAYAINSTGPSYGNQQEFTTATSGGTLPIVTSSSIGSITDISATSGGYVVSDGGSSVTARGVCWSISMNPTTADSHTHDGTGVGGFSSSISGLSFCSYYFVRAYATNSYGTSYGANVEFSTNITNAPEVTLYFAAYTLYNGYIDFKNSLTDAQNVCHYWALDQVQELKSNTRYSYSVTVGSNIFSGPKTSCNPVSNGYYLYRPDLDGAIYIVHTINGVIQSVTYCD